MSDDGTLETACYTLTNVGANMAIKPASNFVNSDIVTDKEDHSDEFKV